MARGAAGRAGTRPVRYRIVVRGELMASATRALEGLVERLSVDTADGFSVITGQIVNQSQLHGVLNWLGDRGIEIVSLLPAEDTGDAREMGG